MRLILAATDPAELAPLDQWVLFSSTGYFNIVPFVTAGYDAYDCWIVGGGGGGGGGNNGYVPNRYGGGAGGGGGGGALRRIIADALTDLPGNGLVTVGAGGAGGAVGTAGAKGGNSIFNGLTAYGGGAGGPGTAATSTAVGRGGGGGSGGGRTGPGNNGAAGAIPGAAGGAAISGGGAGGKGATTTAIGFKGSDGKLDTDETDFGGGGGGGGGHGTVLSSPTNVANWILGGAGGKGDMSLGGYSNGGKIVSTDSTHRYGGGKGGGGGGGVNLANLVGYTNLNGTGGYTPLVAGYSPGGGGLGGSGDTANTLSWRVGSPGGKGCVLVRVYKL